jgi:hypothetical protein
LLLNWRARQGGYHTDKRDNENTDTFVEDVAKRVKGRIQITTDAFLAAIVAL